MDRKAAEMAFHDQRELDRKSMSEEAWLAKYSNKRWYAVVEASRKFVNNSVAARVAGNVVLDFGCGLGGNSLMLAKAGAAQVHAIDISPESVKATKELLEANHFGDRIDAVVMDAEAMTYPDNTFDFIICSGVLHHMDVSKAFPELARVLKPTGTILAIEALGYNPVINLYRKMTPHLRTEWEADHILTLKELRQARESFRRQKVHFFHLLTIGTALLQKTPLFRPMLKISELLDRVVLRIPGVRLMAWQMVFFLSEPRKGEVRGGEGP